MRQSGGTGTSGADPRTSFRPLPATDRNAAMDRMRGFGVLGISYILATAYGLQHAALYRLEIDSESSLDWVAGVIGQVAFDLKASALIMLVFGAGIAHLLDRAEAHGRGPRRFLLWRAVLLFLIGVQPGVHAPLWEGNYHLFVAFFSVLTIMMFRRGPIAQAVVGVALVVAAIAVTPLFQSSFAADGLGLSQYWWPETHPYFDQQPVPDNHPTGYFIVTISLRVAGTTLLGSALYRFGIIQGERDPSFYRKLALGGFLTGVPLAAASVIWLYAADYDPSIALVGNMPNTAAAVPMAIGYLAAFVLWGQREKDGRFAFLRDGLQAVGRMALTNSAVAVLGGMFIIREALGRNFFTRWQLALIAAAVSVAQLWWSQAWLRRFEYGPLEWLLRAVTYRRLPPTGNSLEASQGPR